MERIRQVKKHNYINTQVMTADEEWRYRSTNFLASRRCGQLHVLVTLRPGKEYLVPDEYKAGWIAERVWAFWRREKHHPLLPSNHDSSVIKQVVLSVPASDLNYNTRQWQPHLDVFF
jgi:hypothetical protein